MRRSFFQLLSLLFASSLADSAGAQQSSHGASPLPRDAAIAQLIAAYSTTGCTSRLLEALKITQEECAARVASSKKDCPSLIAEGLPEMINEKQVQLVVARAMGCKFSKTTGKPYDNAPWDRGAEAASLQQHGS